MSSPLRREALRVLMRRGQDLRTCNQLGLYFCCVKQVHRHPRLYTLVLHNARNARLDIFECEWYIQKSNRTAHIHSWLRNPLYRFRNILSLVVAFVRKMLLFIIQDVGISTRWVYWITIIISYYFIMQILYILIKL